MISNALLGLVTFSLALASAEPAPSPAPSGTPTPLPSASPAYSAPPLASPSPSGSSSPTPTTTSSPTPTATSSPTPAPTATSLYKYRFVPRLPPSPAPNVPLIYAVYLNSEQLRDTISIRVETNTVVTKVVSKSGNSSGVLTPAGPGVFVANGKLPKLPFFAHGLSINLDIVAYSADGKSVTVRVPVRLA